MKDKIDSEPQQREHEDLPANQNCSLPPIGALERPETATFPRHRSSPVTENPTLWRAASRLLIFGIRMPKMRHLHYGLQYDNSKS
jgi:hypothetical protein